MNLINTKNNTCPYTQWVQLAVNISPTVLVNAYNNMEKKLIPRVKEELKDRIHQEVVITIQKEKVNYRII